MLNNKVKWHNKPFLQGEARAMARQKVEKSPNFAAEVALDVCAVQLGA